MSIEPDLKDWTWVLERPCRECGFDAGRVDVRTASDRVAEMVPSWQAVLARPEATERPDASTWSPAEYACHVRDVHVLFAERIGLMLAEDDPRFANWDQDVTAVEQRYDLQDPLVVAGELAAAADDMAAALRAVPDDAWERPGRRSNGSRFTVRTLVLYFLHDVEHHLVDVGA